jgi:beta-xylosidase
LDERATVRDRSYGLIDLQWNTKPVYIALKNFLEVTWDELIPLETPDLWITKGKFYGISWQKSDGTKILMYWWDSTTKPTLKKVSEVKVYNPLDGTYKTVTWNTNTVLPVNSSLQIAVYK